MIAISKSNGRPPANGDNSNELTPWQKAHQAYRKEKGETAWEPKVISGQEESGEQEKSATQPPPESETTTPVTTSDASGEEDRVSFADRLPKVKYQRNSVLYRRLAFLITLFVIPLILVLYYVSPLSKLNQITVVGNQHVAKDAIITAADFKTGEGLWPQYWERAINEKRIKKAQPRIKTVSLAITDLNRFQLKVTEYQEVALQAKDNQYAPILENGVVLDETLKKAPEGLPILENVTTKKKIYQILTQYDQLSQQVQQGISQIKYTPSKSNDELLRLYMNDGNQVIVNISNLEQQMKYYPQVAKDMTGKGVIDMEVGIFSYLYPKEAEKATEETAQSQVEENIQ